MKKSDLSKTYRIRGEFVESIKEKSLDFIIETKERIEEADVINALIYKHLKEMTAYRDWETDRKSTRLNSSH